MTATMMVRMKIRTGMGTEMRMRMRMRKTRMRTSLHFMTPKYQVLLIGTCLVKILSVKLQL
jgi:hypothetical protein